MYDFGIDLEKSIAKAINYDQTKLQVDGKKDTYRIGVCIVCDRFIIGCEKRHRISIEELVHHKSRLGVTSYESFYGHRLLPELIKQYEVPDCQELKGILLSPRAKRYSDKDDEFEVCSNCANSLKSCSRHRESPPRHAISNGFVIGSVPKSIIPDQEITAEMCSLLSPIRPFGHVFAYSAGAHKAIRGHYSFFEVDLSHTGSVLNYFLATGANPMVYCVLTGRMTAKQKELVRERALFDTSKMMKLLRWFISESGHPGFKDAQLPENCPKPIIIEDPESSHNTDESYDEQVETSFAGATFHFSSSHDPQEDTGVYETTQKFAVAMLEKTMPTLLVNGGSFANLQELLLENVAALQFPFGIGGPKMKRRTPISALEYYKHCTRLSLRQFMRGDFILILNHMFNRQMCYHTAILKCRTISLGSTLAEKISLLNAEDLNQAILQRQTGQNATGTAGEYLKAVETSCRPVGYSPESAKLHRRQHFAMDDYYGGSAVFLTTTPCDETSFRVRLFVRPEQNHMLPELGDPCDEDHINDCVADFKMRKEERTMYPGACSLMYQHLMQIVTECLIGWDHKTNTGKRGVFGIPLAYARTDEEQGRKTLHSHWQIWIKNFNRCRNALYANDEMIRYQARVALLKYVDNVISTSYSTDFTVTHNCAVLSSVDRQKNFTHITAPISEIYEECKNKKQLRLSRHKDHCLHAQGQVLSCKICSKKCSTLECIDSAIRHWRNKDQANTDKYNTDFEINQAWIDRSVIRHPYDFNEKGEATAALGNLPAVNKWLGNLDVRTTLLRRRFDEHESNHRSTCFKNNKSECRSNLPAMACDNTYLHDNSTLVAEQLSTDSDSSIRHGDDSDSDANICASNISRKNKERDTEDQIRMVQWYYLDGTTEEKSQYSIIPKRLVGSQFLNQHSVPISNILACNTNVSIGDPSHTYYSTLYKSKDTQAEDKTAMLRVNGSFGRRIWRAQQRLIIEREAKDANTSSNDNEESKEDSSACHIEGLGRVMTGINALLSSNIVGCTMGHLMMSQNGERFTYSHTFAHLLVSQLEDALENKDTQFIFRSNIDREGDGSKIQWPDSSANDYIFRPIYDEEIKNCCFYQYTMMYEKHFKSFAEMRNEANNHYQSNINDQESTKRFLFMEEHPGSKYAYMVKRKHNVIPIISMKVGKICDIELLQIKASEVGRETRILREQYAKNALMMFLPFTIKSDLKKNNSYWEKFVQVGGTKRYNPVLIQQHGCIWEYGKQILENIQTRVTAEKRMKRPPDPLILCTETPSCTGERKKTDIDNNEFDTDISELDRDFYLEGELSHEPLRNEQRRTHNTLMKRANILPSSMLRTKLNGEILILSEDDDEDDNANKIANSNVAAGSNIATHCSSEKRQYSTILSFVSGAIIGCNNEENNAASEIVPDSIGINNNSLNQLNPRIPTMREIVDKSGKQLDNKQYLAYEIICCTFLLQIVNEGGYSKSLLSATLNITKEDNTTKKKLVQRLKKKGAQEQLVMFLTGPGGCGKSTLVEIAQQYCHAFCVAASIPFDDITFYFTSTTGSSAALFGGTTIHSAAYLNKTRLTDAMRQIWREQVRILIIDEISFFKASDIRKLDEQLKKLTGVNKVYGGVSIVFSGDFHQLKPICSEAEVLYSGSATAVNWENSINCAIFLDNSHRFKEDPKYGEILYRMRMGETTLEDKKEINKRLINKKKGLYQTKMSKIYAMHVQQIRKGMESPLEYASNI